ncbi:MAG TPA: hypothetical protein PLV45_16630, partial [bacterium]|nr:hypothetical protein [bacterium]
VRCWGCRKRRVTPRRESDSINDTNQGFQTAKSTKPAKTGWGNDRGLNQGTFEEPGKIRNGITSHGAHGGTAARRVEGLNG